MIHWFFHHKSFIHNTYLFYTFDLSLICTACGLICLGQNGFEEQFRIFRLLLGYSISIIGEWGQIHQFLFIKNTKLEYQNNDSCKNQGPER